ncbi:glycosyltransferase family 2 protein [Lactobacillus delbrueckii]|uniref:glycosyltransferase family 2 protein n=1 Tax=Lactobacillus delbrueckii TaxID=1584 RepID=UPI001E5FD2EF|nr:glycosyltransferase [Lactobacillus delbrueckii]MCD5491102.1 glycosyltransferase [Lactobacillus delbrueckii subsp. lactis]
MEEVKVSIIVPVYKAEKSIAHCIESILGQTYHNIELLLIEDGSPDNSGAICDSYTNDPRVKVIHNTNHGVSRTRNTGLEYATGDYITANFPEQSNSSPLRKGPKPAKILYF